MSLLMDALRRAERAKESVSVDPADAGALSQSVAAGPSSERQAARAVPVNEATADGLPALTLDEVTPTPVDAPSAAQPAPARVRPPDTNATRIDPVEQLRAQRMIAARARQSQRRRLIMTAGGGVAILVVALAIVYFEVVVSTNGLNAPSVAQSMPAEEGGEAVSSTAAEAGEVVAPKDQVEAMPVGTEAPAAHPSAAVAHDRSRRVPVPAATGASPMAAVQPAPASSPAPLVIVRNQAEDPLQVLLAQAFDAYQAGDGGGAEDRYRQVLIRDANNRDALLGMAAVAQRGGRDDEARGYYLRLLELNPLDSTPAAGLIGLRGGADPVQDESRIKLLLRQEPDAAYLYFALGTLYVAQDRWAEAQQAYFDAFRRDAANPDYAFNLAVSLDHLGQTVAALDYYRRALELTNGRAVHFQADAAAQRIAALTAVDGGGAR